MAVIPCSLLSKEQKHMTRLRHTHLKPTAADGDEGDPGNYNTYNRNLNYYAEASTVAIGMHSKCMSLERLHCYSL